MLNLDAGPKPEMIAVGTASCSDIVFGLFRLLGYRFSPRIADLADRRFWRAAVPAYRAITRRAGRSGCPRILGGPEPPGLYSCPVPRTPGIPAPVKDPLMANGIPAARGGPAAGGRPVIDTAVSHSARIWDYWLGGKDNYAVDREVGDRIEEMLPDIVRQAREDRLFLGRVVRYLAGEAGIRQFLDIGTGLPTADNTHQVAQRVAPESKIVYVDNDPLVLAHARVLLTSRREGVTDYIDADMHDPGVIIAGAGRVLDLGQPVAITMLGVLWHVLDDEEAYAIVGHLMQAMPSGSYLALNHPTLEVTGEKMATAIRYWNEYGTPPGTHRTPAQLARFFDGMDLVEPGVVSITRWRPEATSSGEPEEIDQFGGVGRKP
jgi:hypothetical protein